MNDIIKDYNKEGYTRREWLVYGALYPTALIAACAVAEWLQRL